MSKRRIAIGLTGSMGSGKSMLANILADQIPVTDADRINEQLLEPGQDGWMALKKAGFEELGCFNPDGTLNKEKTAAAVFADPALRMKMNSLLHPLIFKGIRDFIEAQDGLCAVEVPLLFECGLENDFDEVWTVVVDEKTALERLEKGRHISREQAKARLKTQMPPFEKAARSTRVFDNSGSAHDLKDQADAALKELKEKVEKTEREGMA